MYNFISVFKEALSKWRPSMFINSMIEYHKGVNVSPIDL